MGTSVTHNHLVAKLILTTTHSSMPAIKLTYFDLRARAEPARILLAYSGQPYEDVRLPAPWDAPEKWAAMKKTLAFGQLPKLEWDGAVIYTSLSIARFLARQAGPMGKTSIESAQVDEIVDVIRILSMLATPPTSWMM